MKAGATFNVKSSAYTASEAIQWFARLALHQTFDGRLHKV